MENNKENLDNIIKIKDEIKFLLKDIEEKEKILVNDLEKSNNKIMMLKTCLEEIIEEYHLVCKKIYK
jgi:hypothetical protein